MSTLAKRGYADEFADVVVISRPDGSLVRLGEIAELRDGLLEQDVRTTLDGSPTVLVQVKSVPGASPQEASSQVRGFLEGWQPPGGTRLQVWADESWAVTDSLNLVIQNGVYGLVGDRPHPGARRCRCVDRRRPAGARPPRRRGADDRGGVCGAAAPWRRHRPDVQSDSHRGGRRHAAFPSAHVPGAARAPTLLAALIASFLRSFIQPLLVLAGIPVAFVGAAAGHSVLGYEFTITSLFGLIAVSGVVVNDRGGFARMNVAATRVEGVGHA